MVISSIKEYGGYIIGNFKKFDQIMFTKKIEDDLRLYNTMLQRLSRYKATILQTNVFKLSFFQENSPNTGN